MHSKRRFLSLEKPNTANKSNTVNIIRSIPIAQRAIFYICVMAAVGGVIGEMNYQVESKTCLSNYECWTIEPTKRRFRNIITGTMAGIFAATIISIPAIVEE